MSPREGRRFGLLVGSAFLVLGAISYWRGHHVPPIVLWVLGGLLVVSGLLIPGRLGPVYRGWMKFAVLLSRITTPIIAGIMYFGLFTPIGFIRRLFGRNSMIRPAGDSFWITREPGPARRSDLGRQF